MDLLINLGNVPDAAVLQSAIQQAELLENSFLPYVKNLNNEERKTLRKMGPQRFAYATNALTYGQMNLSALPRDYEPDDFGKIMRYYSDLDVLLKKVDQIREALSDTIMAVGVDAMTHTKAVHDSFRNKEKSGKYDDVLNLLNDFNARSQRDDAETAKKSSSVEKTPVVPSTKDTHPTDLSA